MAARARLTFIFPSGGKARGVESINFFRTCSCKADSNAVGRWRFTVARMCNNKGWLFATIKYPAIAKRAEVIDAKRTEDGTVAKLAMRQPFVLFKGLTFQKLCLPGAFRPGDHHNKMLRPGLCVVHASPQYL